MHAAWTQSTPACPATAVAPRTPTGQDPDGPSAPGRSAGLSPSTPPAGARAPWPAGPAGPGAGGVPVPSPGVISPFDLVHDRTGTGSLKWDFAAERGKPASALPLWVADMDHQAPACVTSALLWRVRHGIFGYSEPDADYDAALVDWFARRYDWAVDPAWNVITAGVVPALALAVRALTEPGRAVVIEEPVYYPFREVVEANGRTVVSVPLVRGADGVYRRDPAALEEALTSTGARLLLLCNPHNPVGRVWSAAELTELAEITGRHGVRVVADEIHADLTLPGHRTTPFASLGAEVAARTITCTSPSKAFNLAGLQIANILIPDPGLREAFTRELAATGYSQPNALGLTACRAAYESGDAWLEELREHIAAARRHVVRRLEAIPGVEACPCEGTYLLWLDCSGLLAASGLRAGELDAFLLEEAGLWLDDGAIFGAGGEGFTRINVACPRATLDAALDRLAAGVEALLSRRTSRPVPLSA
ncbi:MAG: MalY/PatB family protein [Actinomyces sp.]|uniref:MalY/PatB family protein n=1 Tax=Actinomyces sp. TaxID=29317 RepID=UPI0026DD1160|nr:MalY/PatB family protein [Actinomyces sp.]MDO4242857.1 MalY/PatB family protein [Actinomyces sp.]